MGVFSSKAWAALAVAGIVSTAGLAWQSKKNTDCVPCGGTVPISTTVNQTDEPAMADGDSGNLGGDDAASMASGTDDLAFANYFNGALFAAGFYSLNPGMVTDSALGLAEGERSLQRPHGSGVTSSQLLQMAAKLAAKRGDKATLERLAKVAEQRKDAALAKLVETAKTVAGKSRAVVNVDIASVNSSDLKSIEDLSRSVTLAELLGDREALVEIGESLSGQEIPAAIKEDLMNAIASGTEATKDLAPEALGEQAALVDLLSNYQDGERDSNEGSQKAKVAAGGWKVYYGKKIGMVEYAKALAAIAAAYPTGGASLNFYLSNLINQIVEEAFKSVKGQVAKDVIRTALLRAISGKSIVKAGKISVKGGLVTWNNWKTISADYPCGSETKYCEKKVLGKTVKYPCGVKVKMCRKSEKISLPNEHQFYVAFRF